LLNYATTPAQVDKIYIIYKAFRYGFSNLKLGIDSQWQAVSAIQGSTTISDQEKKEIYDELYSLDSTDTKIQWALIIEAKKARGDDRKRIWESCIQENLEFSFHHLQYKLMGLNCGGVPAEERKQTIIDFANKIVELINNRSRSIGKSFLAYFIPRHDDLAEFVEILKKAVLELGEEDRFAKKKIT
jgi:hypothetical protein